MRHSISQFFQEYESDDFKAGARNVTSEESGKKNDSVRHIEGVVVDSDGRLAGGGPKLMGYDLKTYAFHFAPKSSAGKAMLAAVGFVAFPVIAAVIIMALLVLGFFGLAFMLLGPFTSKRK
jgi:hypothetical protein